MRECSQSGEKSPQSGPSRVTGEKVASSAVESEEKQVRHQVWLADWEFSEILFYFKTLLKCNMGS